MPLSHTPILNHGPHHQDDVFYDLGSGRGIVPTIALLEFGVLRQPAAYTQLLPYCTPWLCAVHT